MQLSSSRDCLDDDAEYEEVEDLIYERTGTLLFGYSPRFDESGIRATPAIAIKRTIDIVPDLVEGVPASTVRPRAPSAPRRHGPVILPKPRARATVPRAPRAAQPSVRAKPQVLRAYPTFGQRALAELRRTPLATRSAALGVLVAVAVAGIFFVSGVFATRRVPRDPGVIRPSPAPALQERAPVRAPAALQERAPSSAAPVVAVRAAASAPAGAEPRIRLITPEQIEAERAAAERLAAEQLASRAADEPPAARVRTKRRAPLPPIPHEPCNCLPGDPLCGCLD